MFRPQPAHHAHARSIGRPSQRARSSLRSTVCGLRGPLVASPFLQSGAVRPARPSRKNGAATSRPPAPVGSFAGSRSFPPPARCHVGCSGRSSRGRSCSAGNRRASAPPAEGIISLITARSSRAHGSCTLVPHARHDGSDDGLDVDLDGRRSSPDRPSSLRDPEAGQEVIPPRDPARPRRVTPFASRAKRNAIVRAGKRRAAASRPAGGTRVRTCTFHPRNPSG